MPTSTRVSIEGKQLPLSNLDKVLYPATGFTKAQVVDYYMRVAPVLLPHLRQRALTLKRYPDGVDGESFYEKNCPAFRPSWVRTITVASGGRHGAVRFCVVDDLATLVWVANLAALELHAPLWVAPELERPTVMVFDLDPGAPATIVECCEVALLIRTLLESRGLKAFPKTSGSKGLQLYAPLDGRAGFEETKDFARSVALVMQQEHPELVVASMSKSLRAGKVLIDWSQNDRHKTTVCVYSLRARERPTVSAPVTWREVSRCAARRDPGVLVLDSDQVLSRVAKDGDLFAPVLELKQRLPRL